MVNFTATQGPLPIAILTSVAGTKPIPILPGHLMNGQRSTMPNSEQQTVDIAPINSMR